MELVFLSGTCSVAASDWAAGHAYARSFLPLELLWSDCCPSLPSGVSLVALDITM